MKFALASSLLAALASTPTTSAHGVNAIHGSGTTNPSKCYWNVMDKIEEQTKLPTRLTYRAVGSSTGIKEFKGNITLPVNDFGSGDIPLSTADFNELKEAGHDMIHLPILLGAISFFHSVDTGDQQLKLDACVLAKIFKRDITDWNDQEIKNQNPNLQLENPYPIRVARRVQGSSSTASITQFLMNACPAEWTADMVGAKLTNWAEGTLPCEGSGGMTDCIKEQEGTIGYIDSGHGYSQGLTEIELKNADGNYLSSKEATTLGGILPATLGAGIPDSLESDFGNVNLLYRDGPNTWPIVAMTYVYVRKDLSHIGGAQDQTLLKAFLKALYNDKYVAECEESFGFVRVSGDLRDRALAAIDTLVLSDPDAEEWFFEENTEAIIGTGDYVISQKRKAYSELEQDQVVGLVASLQNEISDLKSENMELVRDVNSLKDEVQTVSASMVSLKATANSNSGTNSAADGFFEDFSGEGSFGEDEETALKAALALSIISFALWMLALVFIFAKFVFKCF